MNQDLNVFDRFTDLIKMLLNNKSEIQRIKKEFKLEKLEYYDLNFSKDFINFLNYLRELDSSLTGVWFIYFFKYCLSFPNYYDYHIDNLERDLSHSINPDNSNPDIYIVNKIDLNADDKEIFIHRFLYAFQKYRNQERLTVFELFDLSLAHPIYKNRSIKNGPEFRERLRKLRSEYVVEIEEFKNIWQPLEINVDFNYRNIFSGNVRLKTEKEIFDIRTNHRLPDDDIFLRILILAFMSPKPIDYFNVLQPLANRIFVWDIRTISQESKENFIQKLIEIDSNLKYEIEFDRK